MFITSPAATGLKTIIFGGEDTEFGRQIVCGSGITIGQLADFRAEVNAANAHSGLDVDINVCKKYDGDGEPEERYSLDILL